MEGKGNDEGRETNVRGRRSEGKNKTKQEGSEREESNRERRGKGSEREEGEMRGLALVISIYVGWWKVTLYPNAS